MLNYPSLLNYNNMVMNKKELCSDNAKLLIT